MKNLFNLLLMVSLSIQMQGQLDIAGIWEISDSKKLFLLEDHSFNMTMGAKLYEGTYDISKNKSNQYLLNLNFKQGKKSYVIKELHETMMQLYNVDKNMTLNLKLIQRFKTNKKDLVQAEENDQLDLAEDKSSVNPQPQPLYKQRKSIFDPFDDGKLIINPSYGIIDYVDGIPNDLFESSHPIALLIEKSLIYRIGFGTRFGYRTWKVQESDIKLSMISVAPRLTFHPNIIQNLDLYAGLATAFRYSIINDGEDKAGRFTYGFSPVVGGRYYFIDRLALSAEFAYDATSNFNVGLCIALN